MKMNPLLSKVSKHSSAKDATIFRALLIDDDIIFGKIIQRQAKLGNVELKYCSSVNELFQVRRGERFDVILLDYDLGSVKGSRIADFLNVSFAGIPIVMVSASAVWWLESRSKWPGCVKLFLQKDQCVNNLLAVALEIVERDRAAKSSDVTTFPRPRSQEEREMTLGVYRTLLAGK